MLQKRLKHHNKKTKLIFLLLIMSRFDFLHKFSVNFDSYAH